MESVGLTVILLLGLLFAGSKERMEESPSSYTRQGQR
ncbi:unnamed protein product, partial [Ectocarpus sp. 6 AP-2014]